MSTDNSSKKNSIISAVAVLLLIGTGIYLTVQLGNNSRLSEQLKNEKLTAESLLSQKLSLDKEISKTKSDLSALETKSSNLDRLLGESTKKLETAERDLTRSRNQSSSLAQLKKQNTEILTQKGELEQQIAGYKNSLGKLQSLTDDLERTVAVLQKQNKNLTAGMDAMRLASMNEILIESTKKNNKQTVKAKRTKNLIINVDVSSKAENLSFKITNPSGREFTDKEGKSGIKTVSENKQSPKAFYVAEDSSVPPPTYNRIQLTYLAKEKLEAGTYNIELFSSSTSIGSLQVKLR